MKENRFSFAIIILLFWNLVFFRGTVFVSEEGFSGGRGTEDEPYLVATYEELERVQNHPTAHFKQVADIKLRRGDHQILQYLRAILRVAGFRARDGWQPIGAFYEHGHPENEPFTGSYDGGGHWISGLRIIDPRGDYVGLFGYLGPEAELKNINLRQVVVHGGNYVGGLAGLNRGMIENCRVTGWVEGVEKAVGGLVGWNWEGRISKSSSGATVEGTGRSIGGLVGYNLRAEISTSSATGRVTGKGGFFRLGRLGGLVGHNHEAVIANSYATGAVSATEGRSIGGLIGYNYTGDVTKSYAAGSVSGQGGVGGLIGTDHQGTVTASYYDAQKTGPTDTKLGSPQTTAEMKVKETYVGWDFTTTWAVEEKSYPYLRWEKDR